MQQQKLEQKLIILESFFLFLINKHFSSSLKKTFFINKNYKLTLIYKTFLTKEQKMHSSASSSSTRSKSARSRETTFTSNRYVPDLNMFTAGPGPGIVQLNVL